MISTGPHRNSRALLLSLTALADALDRIADLPQPRLPELHALAVES